MGVLINSCRKKQNELKKLESNKEDDNEETRIYSFSKQGLKKDMDQTDQDSHDQMINELGSNIKYFAVYDGHGLKGREASNLAKTEIRKLLLKEKSVLSKLKERKDAEKLFKKIFSILHDKFKNLQNEFEASGTCAVGVLLVEKHCFTFNLGDSRCVIGSSKTDNNIANLSMKTAYQMSVDHKVNREDEKKRIESSNGVVIHEHGGYLGPPRVYPMNDEGPGLAVSRSLGDLILHNHGVISEPEITHKEIDSEDVFIVIGSDGIWDVMNSSEVVGFVFDKIEKKLKEEMICELLVNEARTRWDFINQFKMKIQSDKTKETLVKSASLKQKKVCTIDDITAIVCFLKNDSP